MQEGELDFIKTCLARISLKWI